MLPIESNVVFVPVAATSVTSLHAKIPVPSNPFDGELSTFVDESRDFMVARGPRGVVAISPARSVNGRSDCFVLSPTSTAAERSTPLKPAKRDRSADDEDRQILRCKRSLGTPLKTAATSRLDGASQMSPSSTITASESVERRNLRERRRVKLINVTFATLRNRLPSYCWQQRQRQHQQPHRDRRHRGDDTGGAGRGSSRRPSKVDTLRTAINYIHCLQDLLADDDRQRLSTFQTFQTFDYDATDTLVPVHPWTTSPSTAVGYDSCSPATSTSCSSLDDLTTAAAAGSAALTSTNANNSPDFTDEILSRDVNMSPISDMLDWFI